MILNLYSWLWRLGLLPAWAWWAWKTRRDGSPSERGRWRERLAWARLPVRAGHGLLVHAASIGEGVAAVALVRALQRLAPEVPVLVTCTSLTGAEQLRRALGDAVTHAFLPFDTPGAMARLLEQVRPRAIVLMETELWPNLLAAARAQAVPVVLANARLSARSARGYARLAALSAPMLKGLHAVLAQSRPIARRFQALGVPPGRIQITGNIKADLVVPAPMRQRAAAWRDALGGRLVLVAGSTHPGEDECLLAAWPVVRAQVADALLVLVPRHPQRFEAVARLMEDGGHRPCRRSRGDLPSPDDAVWLGDTMSEMLAWFALADLAFIGGSLVPHGGHNPLEAMAFGCPITSGPHVHNFAALYADLDRRGGVQWLPTLPTGPAPAASAGTALGTAFAGLLSDSAARARIGRAGGEAFAAGAGAAGRSAQALAALLASTPGSVRRDDDGQCATWIADSGPARLPADPFDAASWQARGAWTPTAGGRGSAGFIDHGPHGLVLRHYRRGGLVGRWLHDTYLGRNAGTSRAMREFALLAQLRAGGLPVPQPVGARMQRSGLWRYRADLIVERLPDTRTLAERLAAGERLDAAQWHRIGATIRQLHEAGVDHVDLNANNLLVAADGTVWIIDFDRCRARGGHAWRAGNLARLHRSLRKLRRRHPGFLFDDSDWRALESGYQRPAGAG